MDKVVLPATEVPSWRTMDALRKGVAHRLLFTTWGGIGDQICAEPTLRFALQTFKSSEVYLYTEIPELFAHLPFKKVFTKSDKPDFSDFLVLNTINNPESLTWEFVSHCVTHCVDFPSICSIRCTLPINFKAVVLPVTVGPKFEEKHRYLCQPNFVAIHAGKHWESKTFPVEWWDTVLKECLDHGLTPVLFGKEITQDQGTVATDTRGCIDLRDALSLSESIWLLQRMHALICNDSSPMHMAATGKAKIAFVASAKHQDYLYHWRKNDNGQAEWAWRMKHFNTGGLWDTLDYCPNKKETVLVDKCDSQLLKTWLPNPLDVVKWVVENGAC
jgi:hypothetical protein